jgi:hypothetical protein
VAERRAEVVSLGPPSWRLRLLESRCAPCALGCGGRCNAFVSDADGELELSLASRDVPVGLRIGDPVLLRLDDALLRRGAWAGYGRVWLGLCAGAACGDGLARLAGIGPDLPTLAGLAAGTSLAIFLSKHPVAGRGLAIFPVNDNEPV